MYCDMRPILLQSSEMIPEQLYLFPRVSLRFLSCSYCDSFSFFVESKQLNAESKASFIPRDIAPMVSARFSGPTGNEDSFLSLILIWFERSNLSPATWTQDFEDLHVSALPYFPHLCLPSAFLSSTRSGYSVDLFVQQCNVRMEPVQVQS